MKVINDKIELTKEELIELLTFKGKKPIYTVKSDEGWFVDNYGEFEWDKKLLESLPIDIMVQAIINTIKE